MRRKLLSMLALLCLTVTSAWAETTVTITSENLMEAMGNSYTKDGVTLSADRLDKMSIYGSGTFSTSLGKFTKIVITADGMVDVSGGGGRVSHGLAMPTAYRLWV